MKNTAKRVISLVTLACFVMTQSISANPGAGVQIAPKYETPSFLQIDIPNELATLDGVYEAPAQSDPKLILHIQNAHANYGAQQKIKKLLQYLEKTYAIKTIFVEGASEDLNPDYLKMFPDQERNLKLAEFLAQEGELTGAELYLLEADPKQVQGKAIENADLYRENYEALKKVFGAEKTVGHYLGGFESRLDGLASKVFTADLRKLLAEWKKFEKGHREFMPYVRSLTAEAKRILGIDLESLLAQVEWPQMTRLLVLQTMEKELSIEKGLAEKAELVRFLKEKKASEKLVMAIENFQDQRVSVLRSTGDGRSGPMQPRDLMELLSTEAGPKGFYFYNYPNFSLYAGYLILKSELDPKGLFEEFKVLFTQVLDQLAQTERQKALLGLYRDEELVRKLLNLELTRRDWQEARDKRTLLDMDPMVSRLRDLGTAVSRETNLPLTNFETKKPNPKFRAAVMEAQNSAHDFYEAARKREEVFYEKIDSVMAKTGDKKAVLITGGFHTDGITDLLREHEISYGILTPRLSEKSDEHLYRSVMLQNKSSLFELSYLEAAPKLVSLQALKNQGVNSAADLAIALAGIRAVGELSLDDAVAVFNASEAARLHRIQIRKKEGTKNVYKIVTAVKIKMNPLTHKVITIDGPSAVWKSESAEAIARQLGYLHVDSGAIYRALTAKALREGTDLNDVNEVETLIQNTVLEFGNRDGELEVIVDGQSFDRATTRSAEVTKNVGLLARHYPVALRIMQEVRKIGEAQDIVVEGRNTGMEVFPDAFLKFYITADMAQRAQRRHEEYQGLGDTRSLAEIQAELEKRDVSDSERDVTPLWKPEDSVEIDNTKFSFDENVAEMMKTIQSSQARAGSQVQPAAPTTETSVVAPAETRRSESRTGQVQAKPWVRLGEMTKARWWLKQGLEYALYAAYVLASTHYASSLPQELVWNWQVFGLIVGWDMLELLLPKTFFDKFLSEEKQKAFYGLAALSKFALLAAASHSLGQSITLNFGYFLLIDYLKFKFGWDPTGEWHQQRAQRNASRVEVRTEEGPRSEVRVGVDAENMGRVIPSAARSTPAKAGWFRSAVLALVMGVLSLPVFGAGPAESQKLLERSSLTQDQYEQVRTADPYSKIIFGDEGYEGFLNHTPAPAEKLFLNAILSYERQLDRQEFDKLIASLKSVILFENSRHGEDNGHGYKLQGQAGKSGVVVLDFKNKIPVVNSDNRAWLLLFFVHESIHARGGDEVAARQGSIDFAKKTGLDKTDPGFKRWLEEEQFLVDAAKRVNKGEGPVWSYYWANGGTREQALLPFTGVQILLDNSGVQNFAYSSLKTLANGYRIDFMAGNKSFSFYYQQEGDRGILVSQKKDQRLEIVPAVEEGQPATFILNGTELKMKMIMEAPGGQAEARSESRAARKAEQLDRLRERVTRVYIDVEGRDPWWNKEKKAFLKITTLEELQRSLRETTYRMSVTPVEIQRRYDGFSKVQKGLAQVLTAVNRVSRSESRGKTAQFFEDGAWEQVRGEYVANIGKMAARIKGLPEKYTDPDTGFLKTPHFNRKWHNEGPLLEDHLAADFRALGLIIEMGPDEDIGVPAEAVEYIQQWVAKRRWLLEFFILFHDIGKLDTVEPKKDVAREGYRFHHHEMRSFEILTGNLTGKRISYKGHFPNDIPWLPLVIKYHDIGYSSQQREDFQSFLKELGAAGVTDPEQIREAVEFLIAASTLDSMGSYIDASGNLANMNGIRSLIDLFKAYTAVELTPFAEKLNTGAADVAGLEARLTKGERAAFQASVMSDFLSAVAEFRSGKPRRAFIEKVQEEGELTDALKDLDFFDSPEFINRVVRRHFPSHVVTVDGEGTLGKPVLRTIPWNFNALPGSPEVLIQTRARNMMTDMVGAIVGNFYKGKAGIEGIEISGLQRFFLKFRNVFSAVILSHFLKQSLVTAVMGGVAYIGSHYFNYSGFVRNMIIDAVIGILLARFVVSYVVSKLQRVERNMELRYYQNVLKRFVLKVTPQAVAENEAQYQKDFDAIRRHYREQTASLSRRERDRIFGLLERAQRYLREGLQAGERYGLVAAEGRMLATLPDVGADVRSVVVGMLSEIANHNHDYLQKLKAKLAGEQIFHLWGQRFEESVPGTLLELASLAELEMRQPVLEELALAQVAMQFKGKTVDANVMQEMARAAEKDLLREKSQEVDKAFERNLFRNLRDLKRSDQKRWVVESYQGGLVSRLTHLRENLHAGRSVANGYRDQVLRRTVLWLGDLAKIQSDPAAYGLQMASVNRMIQDLKALSDLSLITRSRQGLKQRSEIRTAIDVASEAVGIDLREAIGNILVQVDAIRKAQGKAALTNKEQTKIWQFAELVAQAHKNQTRKGDSRPYFVHLVEVVRRAVEEYGATSPLAIIICLLHDAREDQEDSYELIKMGRQQLIDQIEEFSSQAAGEEQVEFNNMRLGVALLSKIESEELPSSEWQISYKNRNGKDVTEPFKSKEDADNAAQIAYLDRLVNPHLYYNKESRELTGEETAKRWRYSPYDDAFIRAVQQGKLSDRNSNLDDLLSLFTGKADLTDKKLSGLPAKTFRKTLDFFIPFFVEARDAQNPVNEADRRVFYQGTLATLIRYATLDTQTEYPLAQPLKDAALDALKKLAQDPEFAKYQIIEKYATPDQQTLIHGIQKDSAASTVVPIIQITNDNMPAVLKDATVVVYAGDKDHCAPCREFAPTFEAMAKSTKTDKKGRPVTFATADLSKPNPVRRKFLKNTDYIMPVVLVIADGELLGRHDRKMAAEELETFISSTLRAEVRQPIVRSESRTAPQTAEEIRAQEAFLDATKNIEGVREGDVGAWERLQNAFGLLRGMFATQAFTKEERMGIEYQRFVNQLDAKRARVRRHQGELGKPQDYYGGEEMQRWYEAMETVDALEKDASKATPEFLKLLHARAYLNTPQTYYEYRKINDAFGRQELTEAERDKALEDLLQYEQAKNDFKSRKKVRTEKGKDVFFDEKMRDERMGLGSVLRGLYWSVTHLGRPWQEGVTAHNGLIGKFREDPRDELQYVHSNTVTMEGIKQADLITVGPVFTLSEMQKLTRNEHFGETRPDGTVNYDNLNPLIDLREGLVRRYQGPYVLKYTEAGNGEYDWRNPKTPAFNAILFYTPVAKVEPAVQSVFQSFQQKLAALQKSDPERKNITVWVDLILDFQKEVVMIHPFLDGNGRTSRLLTDFLFGVIGLPPPLFPNEQDVIAAPEKSRQFALKAMKEYLLAYRNLLLIKGGAALPVDSLQIPTRARAPSDPSRENGTQMGHDQFPTNPTVTTIVIVKTADGKLVLTKRDGKLALAERYVLGGESANDTAEAALTDPDAGLGMKPGEVQVGETIAFESKPSRSPALYRYSAVVEARVSAVPDHVEVVDPATLNLEEVLPEHREILRKYLSGEDLLARGPGEGLVNVRDYKKRSAVEKPSDPLKAKATQGAHEMINANGFVQPVVASDTVIEYYDQDGNFQGIVLIERLRDGHLATPGGFARQNEPAEYNAAREDFEETGLPDIKLERLLRLATRGNRDERSFIWSPLFLGRVQGRRPTAGDDAKSIRIFKTRAELEQYLLDPKNWVRANHPNDTLTSAEESLLEQIRRERAKTGKIDHENMAKLQSLMENRRRDGKFGVLWADHLEHLMTYFEFKEQQAAKIAESEAAINLDAKRLVIDVEQLITAGGKINYQMLVSLKNLISNGISVAVVGKDKEKAIFESLLAEMAKSKGIERATLAARFVFMNEATFQQTQFDASTLSLSRRVNNTGTVGRTLRLDPSAVDRSADFELTTFFGFLKWMNYSKVFSMRDDGAARPFDYEKAMILFRAGVSLDFYKDYYPYSPDQLRSILVERNSKLARFVRRQNLSDLHTHPTGGATAGFVLEMAWRDLQKSESKRQIHWSSINREFEKNIDDLGYGSIEEIFLARDLAAIHYLIATPHKTDDKSLVEYFQRYGIIQNVSQDEDTVVRIARDVADQSARQGVNYLELRFASATKKNEDLVQEDYLPRAIGGSGWQQLGAQQLTYLLDLPESSPFRQLYEYDSANKRFVLRTGIDMSHPAAKGVFPVLKRLNLIGMETLINIMANYRGLKQAQRDHSGFRFKMLVILPKPDSRELSGQTIEEVSRLKRIARALRDGVIKGTDPKTGKETVKSKALWNADDLGKVLAGVLPDAAERAFYVQQIFRQKEKDSIDDIVDAMEQIVGLDTAGPEFLYMKAYPKQLSDFIVEFDSKLSVEDKTFLRAVAYSGNWISGGLEKKFNQYSDKSIAELESLQKQDPGLGLQDLIRFRQILEKVKYSGRVRFMAQKLKGVFDQAMRETFPDGTRLFRESTSHAGEAYASLEEGLIAVREAIDHMGVTRIGHGIAVGTDPEELLGTMDGYGQVYDVDRINRLVEEQKKLMKYLIEKGVAIEINVSSNLQTGNVPDVYRHPFFRLLEAGVPLVIGTDGLIVSNTSIADEIVKAAMAFNLGERETQILIDQIASRLGILDINSMLSNPVYRDMINQVPASQSRSTINRMKILTSFPVTGETISATGRELGVWLETTEIPLDILDIAAFVQDLPGVRSTQAWLEHVQANPHWKTPAYQQAKDLAARLSRKEPGALAEYAAADPAVQKYVLVVIFCRILEKYNFNDLSEQLDLFKQCKNELAKSAQEGQWPREESVALVWFENLFQTQQKGLSEQVRGPPAPASKAVAVEIEVRTTGKTQNFSEALNAFAANYLVSPNLVKFRLRRSDPSFDAVYKILSQQYSADHIVVEDADTGTKGQILITDDENATSGYSQAMVISRGADLALKYRMNSEEVSGNYIVAGINKAIFQVSNRLVTVDQARQIIGNRKVLAMTGFTMQKFDKTKAKAFLRTLLRTLNPRTTALVMGVNEDGYDKLILETVAELEKEQGEKFLVIGAMPSEGYQWAPGNVDYLVEQGKTWPEDTAVFLKLGDVVHRLGGGPFARDRTYQAARLGIPTMIPWGYGGVSDEYGIESPVQRKRFVQAIHAALFSDQQRTLEELAQSDLASQQFERVLIADTKDQDAVVADLTRRAVAAKAAGKKVAVFFDGSDRGLGQKLWALAGDPNSGIIPIALVGKDGFSRTLVETQSMIAEDGKTIGQLMDGLLRMQNAPVEVIGDAGALPSRNYPVEVSAEEKDEPLPSLTAGSKAIAIPAAEAQQSTWESAQGKAVLRVIGGSPDLSETSPERIEFYYRRLESFFDDLLTLYTHPSKVALMIELDHDLFHQLIIQKALEKGITVIGGVREGKGIVHLDPGQIKGGDKIRIVKHSSDLWGHTDATLVFGGSVNKERQHMELLESRMNPERGRRTVLIDGFGNGRDSLTDQYSEEYGQPRIADARSLVVHLQPRLSKWIIDNEPDRAKSEKLVKKLKLEANENELRLAYQRSNYRRGIFSQAELLQNLAASEPILGSLLGSPNHGWEGGTLGDHTLRVMEQFQKQLDHILPLMDEASRKQLEQMMPMIELAVALHDIGKPIDHDRQHQETIKIIKRKFSEWGISPAQTAVAEALIMGDSVGRLLYATDYSKEKALEVLRSEADALGVSRALFYALAVAYYMADSSSYPGARLSGYVEQTDGSVIFKRDYAQFSTLLDLMEQDTTGAFKAPNFRTETLQDTPGVLPEAVREMRFGMRGEFGAFARFSYFDGREMGSPAEVIQFCVRYGITSRLGLDATGPAGIDSGTLETALREAIARGEDSKRMIIVARVNTRDQLRKIKSVTEPLGIRILTLAPLSFLEPDAASSVPRSDYWFINNKNDKAALDIALQEVSTGVIVPGVRSELRTHEEMSISSLTPGMPASRNLTSSSWNDILDYYIRAMQEAKQRGEKMPVTRFYVDIDNTIASPMGFHNSEEQIGHMIRMMMERNGMDLEMARNIVFEYSLQQEQRMIQNGFYAPAAQLDVSRLRQLQDLGVEIIGLTGRSDAGLKKDVALGLLGTMDIGVKQETPQAGQILTLEKVLFVGYPGDAKAVALERDLDAAGIGASERDRVVCVDDLKKNTDALRAKGATTVRLVHKFQNHEDMNRETYIRMAKDTAKAGLSGYAFEYLINAYDQSVSGREMEYVLALARQLLPDLAEFQREIDAQEAFMKANDLKREDLQVQRPVSAKPSPVIAKEAVPTTEMLADEGAEAPATQRTGEEAEFRADLNRIRNNPSSFRARDFNANRLAEKLSALFEHEGPSAPLLKKYVPMAAKKAADAMQENREESTVLGVSGEVSGLYELVVNRGGILRNLESGRLEAVNPIVYDGRKELDARTWNTVLESKFHGKLLDVMIQVMGGDRDQLSHLQAILRDRELAGIRNVVYFAENDGDFIGQAVRAYLKQTRDTRGLVVTDKGFSIKLRLQDMTRFLFNPKVLAVIEKNEIRGPRAPRWQNMQSEMDRWINSKLFQLGPGEHFDVIIAVSNAEKADIPALKQMQGRAEVRAKIGTGKTIGANEVMARLNAARAKDEAVSTTPNQYIPGIYALVEKGAKEVVAADLSEIDAANAMVIGARLLSGPGYRRVLKSMDAEIQNLESVSSGDEAFELFKGKILKAMVDEGQSLMNDTHSAQILTLALKLAWVFRDPTYFRQLAYTFFGTAPLPTSYALLPAFEPVKKGLPQNPSVALSAEERRNVELIRKTAREIMRERGADGRGLNYDETHELVLSKIKDALLTPAGISALLNQISIDRLYDPEVAAHYNEWVVEVLLRLKEDITAKPVAGQMDVAAKISDEILLLLSTLERDRRKANQALLPGELTFQDLFSAAPGGFLSGYKRVILFSSYSGREEGVKDNPAAAAALREELLKLAEGIDPSEVLFIAGATPFGGDMTGMRVAHDLGFKLLGVLPAYSLKYVPVKMDHYFVIEEGERGDESDVLREIATRVRDKGAVVAVMGGGDQSYNETSSMLALGLKGLLLTGVHERDERDRVGASSKTAEDLLLGVKPAELGQEIRIRDVGREALAKVDGQAVEKITEAITYALLHTYPSLDALSKNAFDRYPHSELGDWFKPYVEQLRGTRINTVDIYDIFSAAIRDQGGRIRDSGTEASAQAVLGALAESIHQRVGQALSARAEIREVMPVAEETVVPAAVKEEKNMPQRGAERPKMQEGYNAQEMAGALRQNGFAEDVKILETTRFAEVMKMRGKGNTEDVATRVARIVGGILELSKGDPQTATEELHMLAVSIGAKATGTLVDAFKKKYQGSILPVGEQRGFVIDFMDTLPTETKWQAIEAVLALNPNQHYGMVLFAVTDPAFRTRLASLSEDMQKRLHIKGDLSDQSTSFVLRKTVQGMFGDVQKAGAYRGAGESAFVVTGSSVMLDKLGEGLPAALVERGSDIAGDLMDTAGTAAAAGFSQELLAGDRLSEKTEAAIKKSDRRFRFDANGLRGLLAKVLSEIQGLQSIYRAA